MKYGVSLLIIAGLAGCPDARDEQGVGHLIYTSPMGLEVWGTGPGCSTENSTGTWSDGMAWHDRGYATWDDLGAAMDAGVNAFAQANPTIPIANVWTAAKSARYYIQDDYVFWPGPNSATTGFAAGSFLPGNRARITLALWTRGTTQSTVNPYDGSTIPAGTPDWTIRSPEFGAPTLYPYWRYGTQALVPALGHELGNFWGLDPE
jgi:hypothetical protein